MADETPEELAQYKLSSKNQRLLAQGFRTDLIENIQDLNGVVRDAKIRLKRLEDKKVKAVFEFKQPELVIPNELFGKKMSDHDKQKLIAGETIGPINEKGNQYFVNIDKDLNRIIISQPHEIGVPNKIGGYSLTDNDKYLLANNKELPIRLLIDPDGNAFLTKVSLSAEKNGIVFSEMKPVKKNQIKSLTQEYNVSIQINPTPSAQKIFQNIEYDGAKKLLSDIKAIENDAAEFNSEPTFRKINFDKKAPFVNLGGSIAKEPKYLDTQKQYTPEQLSGEAPIDIGPDGTPIYYGQQSIAKTVESTPKLEAKTKEVESTEQSIKDKYKLNENEFKAYEVIRKNDLKSLKNIPGINPPSPNLQTAILSTKLDSQLKVSALTALGVEKTAEKVQQQLTNKKGKPAVAVSLEKSMDKKKSNKINKDKIKNSVAKGSNTIKQAFNNM